MFKLELSSDAELVDDFRCYEGVITLGDFSEQFLASAALWDAARYRQQWKDAARRLLGSKDRTAFITSFIHPDADHNVAWVAWCVGQAVVVQNHLLLRENLAAVLDVDHIERFVGDRRTMTPDGQAVSEWTVTLAEIGEFAA